MFVCVCALACACVHVVLVDLPRVAAAIEEASPDDAACQPAFDFLAAGVVGDDELLVVPEAG